jgi:hypothetical protein
MRYETWGAVLFYSWNPSHEIKVVQVTSEWNYTWLHSSAVLFSEQRSSVALAAAGNGHPHGHPSALCAPYKPAPRLINPHLNFIRVLGLGNFNLPSR